MLKALIRKIQALHQSIFIHREGLISSMFSSVSNFKTQKMINKIYFKTICAVAVLTVLNSCVKSDDYSVPPITCTDKFPATNHALSILMH